MQMSREDVNIQVGKRLREARVNMNKSKEEFAATLDVTEEHYRKLEAGSSGLSVYKIVRLHQTYGIDPAYLIIGISSHSMSFDLDYFVANSTREQRNEFFDHVLAYLSKLIK